MNLPSRYKYLYLTCTLNLSYLDVYANHISTFLSFCYSANSEQLRERFLKDL